MFRGNMLEIIPEESIKEAAEICPDLDNNFYKLLEYGKEFKSADLTPIYIMDVNSYDVYVTSKERVDKRYH